MLNDDRHFSAYDRVEALRRELLADKTVLQVEDFGAGSAVSNTFQRSISSIARHAAKSKKFSQLLFRIVQYYQPATILNWALLWEYPLRIWHWPIPQPAS
ncbi:hypothetical protein [Paraflavitalea speifideaquila]|uniref:hypothetical protein n=1 Tax=Paraflavitalea speifideaquila TaxID=3076558 RepID=UPI0028E61C42|nr:hypothetical protein [Paraflavitalea speifideiaquila]